MKRNDYLFYKDYLKNRDILNKKILVSKSNDSYLIGPLIDKDFDESSFYKRILSNSIYETNIYKRCFKNKITKLLDKYYDKLKSNQIIEIKKNNEIIVHEIIKVPGDIYEK